MGLDEDDSDDDWRVGRLPARAGDTAVNDVDDECPGVWCHPFVPFPVAALPPWLRTMAEAVAASAQADASMAATAALGVVSASVGRKGFVWLGRRRFPLPIWSIAIGESGDGKSSVFDELGAPLRAVQRLPEATEVSATSPRGLSSWERLRLPAGYSTPPPLATLANAVDVVRGALASAGNHPLRLLLDDVTPTTLIDALGSQATGSALISPEGGFESWLVQGGPVASQNAATLNRAWDGEDFTRERQDRTVRVVRPALTLLVGMQPDVFRLFVGNEVLRRRGFTGRFLFVRSEARRRVYPAPEIPADVRAAYDAHIYRLVSLPGWPPTDPVRLEVQAGAAQLNADFLNRLEARMDTGGDLQQGREYLQRSRANLPRLAGLLHLARHSGDHGNAVVDLPIGEETMVAAVEIATYFMEEGVAALSQQPTSGPRFSPVDAVERLLRDPLNWVGGPDDLVAALERVTTAAERTGWPRGTNNIMRFLRDHVADLNPRAISFSEDRVASARMIMLTRRERPPEG